MTKKLNINAAVIHAPCCRSLLRHATSVVYASTTPVIRAKKRWNQLMYVSRSVELGISSPRHNGQSARQPNAELVPVTNAPKNNRAARNNTLSHAHLRSGVRSALAAASGRRAAAATIVAQASMVNAAPKWATTVIG